jgi:hypothetical protein
MGKWLKLGRMPRMCLLPKKSMEKLMLILSQSSLLLMIAMANVAVMLIFNKSKPPLRKPPRLSPKVSRARILMMLSGKKVLHMIM